MSYIKEVPKNTKKLEYSFEVPKEMTMIYIDQKDKHCAYVIMNIVI